jgi:hypothetical protein
MHMLARLKRGTKSPAESPSILAKSSTDVPETKIPPAALTKDGAAVEVMISINVKSMAKSAARLKTWLEAHGVKVWVCTVNLSGGQDFREGIVHAAKRCAVFMPLINDAWARSGECKDEFNLAKRLNLTSTEMGR